MSQPAAANEALGALERLYAKNVITLEEGQAAARAIARDEAYVFPSPPKPAEAKPEPAPKAEAEPAAEPARALETPETTSNGDGPSAG